MPLEFFGDGCSELFESTNKERSELLGNFWIWGFRVWSPTRSGTTPSTPRLKSPTLYWKEVSPIQGSESKHPEKFEGFVFGDEAGWREKLVVAKHTQNPPPARRGSANVVRGRHRRRPSTIEVGMPETGGEVVDAAKL